jgi:superfamily I DNA/RNA helicase
MKMGLALLRQGIPSYVLGKDLSKSLIALTKKLAKDDQKPLTALSAALDRWENNELANAALTGKQERNSTIVDRAECLRALIDGLGGGNAGDLRGLITRLLSREHGEFALGTIHAAKGLEWTHVVHLDPWRLPSRQAREAYANGDSAPMEQENNLRYVCETRTRHTLINASQEGFA